MNRFPFPDRIQSREELKRDVLYRKIPEADRISICDMAWKRGARISEEVMEKYPGKDIRGILGREGLTVTMVCRDEVRGKIRTFGEFYPTKKEIVLYMGSIAKWAEANHLDETPAVDLILAHEFFHYLECTKIGETSRLYFVPVMQIGKFTLGKSGIRALSEIAAHGFTSTYFETCGSFEAMTWEREERK